MWASLSTSRTATAATHCRRLRKRAARVPYQRIAQSLRRAARPHFGRTAVEEAVHHDAHEERASRPSRREGERGFAWDINATVGAQNFVMPDDLDGWFTPSAMMWILAVWSAVLTVAMAVWYSRRTANWDHSAAPRKRRNRSRVAEPL